MDFGKHYYKDSGGDGIPAELFKILKDNAVKMLHSVFIPISKKSKAKECSDYCTVALTSHASKVVLR